MKLNLNKKQTINLLILFLLVITLPLALILAGKVQEIRKEAAQAIVQFSLEPNQGQKERGQTFTLQINLTSREIKQARAADTRLQLDPNVFQIISANCETPFQLESSKIINNQDGTLELGCFSGSGSSPRVTFQPNQKVKLGKIQVKVKDNATLGEQAINFSQTKVVDPDTRENLADNGTGARFTVTQPDSPPVTSPTTPPSPDQVQVRLKVKFAGVDQKRADQNIKVEIRHANDPQKTQALDNVIVSADDQGVYQSNWLDLTSEITTGSGYLFIIQGPKHLAMEFCNTSNQPSCDQTTPTITLYQGQDNRNQLDFSSQPLPPGDLPHPEQGQDNTANSVDASLLISCFATPEEPSCLTLSNLNFDGIVNTIDMNLMNQTIKQY